jgi:Ca2+-binding RTX toxin-like protein
VRFALRGSSGADLVAGSIRSDFFYVSGKDILSGDAGDDTFFWGAPTDVVAGTNVNGNGGTDTLSASFGDFNFTGVTLNSVERVHIASGATLTFTGAQMAGITTVRDQAGFSWSVGLTVIGSTINLSTVSFSNWTSDWFSNLDIININGTAGADTLVGSTEGDRLSGGFGSDSLTGGAGDDRYIYAPGGGADTIVGFVAGAGTEDKIDLTAVAYIRELNDALARATQKWRLGGLFSAPTISMAITGPTFCCTTRIPIHSRFGK